MLAGALVTNANTAWTFDELHGPRADWHVGGRVHDESSIAVVISQVADWSHAHEVHHADRLEWVLLLVQDKIVYGRVSEWRVLNAPLM